MKQTTKPAAPFGDGNSNKNSGKNGNSNYPYWLLIPVISGCIIGALISIGII